MVKNPPANAGVIGDGKEWWFSYKEPAFNAGAQDTWVQSLGWEDALEKEMATHSNILARRIPWTEEPGEPQSVDTQSQT